MTMLWVPDASSIALFRQSPESFRLRHRQHLRPPRTLQNQASAGSAFHVALDLWFREPASNIALARAGLRAAWESESLLEEARPLALMERILEGYARQWPRERDPFTIVSTEAYVEAAIPWSGGTFRYCGIVDRKLAMADGSQYIMDTKTTGSVLNETYFRLMRQSDQMIGYVAMERALGRPCDGFFVDAVHVSDRASRSAPELRREGPVHVPQWRTERWAEDVAWTLRQIADLEAVRGIDKPWPVHHNWSFGKPDAYWEFVEQPPELHRALRASFEEEPWQPAQVAAQRHQAKLLAKISQ